MFSYTYDFSIVMGYYNRRSQTIRTLDKFADTYKSYNYEVIIVDDNSNENHDLSDVISNYKFPINYIKISKEEKGKRLNPSSVYNRGFREANGKIVIIQNPECIHVGNLLEYVKKNLTTNDYKSFSCYNCGSEELTLELLHDINKINNTEFNNNNTSLGLCWYNHPVIRPVHYHFCAAIHNDNLKLLGGFDEEYAKGHGYDDNELLLSIKNNLNLNIVSIDPSEAGFVIHQWHAREAENEASSSIENKWWDSETIKKLVEVNKTLYENMLQHHVLNTFDYPKLLHLYWDGSNFSYLNLLTVLSFNKYHKFWKINVFCPLNPVKGNSWKTGEQSDKYTGKNYFDDLKKIPNVNIHYIDFDNIPFSRKDASEVIKSDYFRLYILNNYGGLWSDFDIVYTNSVEKYHNLRKKPHVRNMVIYRYWWKELNRYAIPIGLFLSNKNNSVLNTILKQIERYYHPDYYQCLGCQMFQHIFNKEHYNESKDVLKQMKLSELWIEDAYCYLPAKWDELDMLFKNPDIQPEKFETDPNVFGIHWFNGAKDAKDYCNSLNLDELKTSEPVCLIDKLVKTYI